MVKKSVRRCTAILLADPSLVSSVAKGVLQHILRVLCLLNRQSVIKEMEYTPCFIKTTRYLTVHNFDKC